MAAGGKGSIFVSSAVADFWPASAALISGDSFTAVTSQPGLCAYAILLCWVFSLMYMHVVYDRIPDLNLVM